MAYESTTVAVEKSQGEIRKLLARSGATEFQFGEGTGPDGNRWSGLSFQHDGQTVLMKVPLKSPTEEERRAMHATARRARTRTLVDIELDYWEQEARRIWRVLYWSLKARMVSVEEEVETFEQAFLAHLVDPQTGMTIWDYIKPAIERGSFAIGGGGMKGIGPGATVEDFAAAAV